MKNDTDGRQGELDERRFTKTGVGVMLYRGIIEKRTPASPLPFHQATRFAPPSHRLQRARGRAVLSDGALLNLKSNRGAEDAAKTLGTIQGQLYARRAMLQIQSANAAASLLVAYDNAARNAADFCAEEGSRHRRAARALAAWCGGACWREFARRRTGQTAATPL